MVRLYSVDGGWIDLWCNCIDKGKAELLSYCHFFFSTNLTWTVMVLNGGLRPEKPATSHVNLPFMDFRFVLLHGFRVSVISHFIFQVWIPSFAILRISKTKRKRDNGHIETTARRNITNKKERGKMLYLKFIKCNILINFKFIKYKKYVQ
jgi:hypothetical protein